ncbi:MAG: hypothetical protein ABI675_30475 [Chitinophagaceae bacterium]
MADKNIACGYNENFEILVNEISEEQKLQQKTTADLVNAVNNSTKKLESLENKIEQVVNDHFQKFGQLLEQKLDSIKSDNRQVDIIPLKEEFKKGFTEIRLILASGPKPVIKKFQILLFPEQDAKLFYKIVFGRWFMWLAVMLVLSLTYKWIIHREDNNKQMMIEAWKNEKIIKAWGYLYGQKNKDLHRLMDSAMKKTDTPSK